MLRMLDRHAVQELLRAGLTPRAIATQYGVSRRTVERIRHEEAVTATDVADRVIHPKVGRPRVDDALRVRVREWLAEERDLSPGEICRRLREAGTPLGLRFCTACRCRCQPRGISATPIGYVAALHAFGPTFDSGGIRALTSVYTMILCGFAVRPLRWTP